MRQWLVEFDGGKEHLEADDVEITAPGVLVFYRSEAKDEAFSCARSQGVIVDPKDARVPPGERCRRWGTVRVPVSNAAS